RPATSVIVPVSPMLTDALGTGMPRSESSTTPSTRTVGPGPSAPRPGSAGPSPPPRQAVQQSTRDPSDRAAMRGSRLETLPSYGMGAGPASGPALSGPSGAARI